MKYRTLGKTGIKVSPYCLGAMMLGAVGGNPDHEDSIRIIHKALDAGINFIDTADRYSQGVSEEIVGKALKGRRENVVLSTKVNGTMGDDPNQQGNSRRWLIREVEASLRRLQTDHIDIYLIHRPSPDTDIEETLSALTDLMRAGKVRAIGSSTFPASDIVEAQWVAERRALARFRVEQPPYSILSRGIEREVLPVCQRYGMGVMAWSPLARGMLTGKYRKGQPLPDSLRVKFSPKQMSDVQRLDAVEQLLVVAEQAGLPLTSSGNGFRGGPPRCDVVNSRPAHYGTARRSARGRRGRSFRRHSGRYRPDRSPGNRRRDSRRSQLRPVSDQPGKPAPPPNRRPRRCLTRYNKICYINIK